MYLTLLIQKMFIIFIPVLIGFYCRKTHLFNDNSNKSFSKLMTEITLPCLIFYSVACQSDKYPKNEFINILGISLLLYAFLILISVISSKLYFANKDEIGIIKFVTVFNNCTFMGLPILSALLGDIAVFYIAIFNIVNSLLVFTIGLYFIGLSASNMQNFSLKLLINSGNIMTIISVILFCLNINPHIILRGASEMIGNMTTPLSMIVLGISLYDIKVKEFFEDYKLYVFAIIKLIVIPIVIYLFLMFIKIENKNLLIAITVLSGMPGASITVTLANQYDSNPKLASKYVLLSTILSIITLPLLVYIIQ